MMRRVLLIVLCATMAVGLADADEGMWLPTQLGELDLEAAGLEISASEIYSEDGASLAHAVVYMGATGELVSGEGLLLTNHHVAFFGVQRASTQGKDYMENGFLARTRDEEIPAPGYSASVLLSIEDVTDQVLEGIETDDLVLRGRLIDERIRAMEGAIEAGEDDLNAEIKPMFAGRQYIQFVHRRYDDVRLVWIPPRSIGNYGGDIDNWMWPRHTGDFSFLRVYTAPDGSGRDYHPENVPLRPKRWLKVASQPLRDGDATFILGYPGRTTRYRTSYDVRYHLEQYYPEAIVVCEELILMLEELAEGSQEAAVKAAGLIKGLNNRMKNYQGNVVGMRKTGFVEQKRSIESDLMAWVNADAERRARYGTLMSDFEQAYVRRHADHEIDAALMRLGRLSGQLVGLAKEVYWAASQRELPELERDPDFSERKIERNRSRLKYRYMTYLEDIDRALLASTLQKISALPVASRIEPVEELISSHGSIDQLVESIYEGTSLADPEHAATLYDLSLDELNELDDPMMQLVARLYPAIEKLRLRREASDAEIDEATRRLIRAIAEWRQQPVYSDANSTLRFTMGRVRGYEPRDAVLYRPFTLLDGMAEKHTGEPPFDAPADLMTLAGEGAEGRWVDEALGDVPVAFLHECDITGGNSGSPVLDARGELVGIAFDGNWEALTGDWMFQPEIQRTISVDIRYVLYLAEHLAKADHLLAELGVEVEQ